MEKPAPPVTVQAAHLSYRKVIHVMVAEDRILDEWAAAWSAPSHAIERVLALFTDDCLYEDVTMGVVNHGKEELKAFAELVFAVFPDFKIEMASSFVAERLVRGEWSMSGTHQGAMPGLPATGRRFLVRGATILELQGSKIRRCSDYWDLATFLKQVGLIPEPEPARA
jgi:steroid delta-isomerase-like uncharacterized protein